MWFIWKLNITVNVEGTTNISNLSNLGINLKIIALELNIYYDNISRNKKGADKRPKKFQKSFWKSIFKLAVS